MNVAKSHVIDILQKKTLEKIISQFELEVTYENVDEGFFIFKLYGNAIFMNKPWEPGVRTDIIHFNKKQDSTLRHSLKIRDSAPKAAYLMTHESNHSLLGLFCRGRY